MTIYTNADTRYSGQPWVREAVTFGISTEAQREAWRKRQGEWLDWVRVEYGSETQRRALDTYGQKWSTAYAYAMGWVDALKAYAPGERYAWWDKASAWALAFADEWRHEAWLFGTEQTGHASGYGNAWDEVVRRNALDYREHPGGDYVS